MTTKLTYCHVETRKMKTRPILKVVVLLARDTDCWNAHVAYLNVQLE